MAAEPEGCCSCCFGFIITMGLAALFIWLSLRVEEPKCYLEHIYVPALNKTLYSTSNSTLLFTLKLVNENKDKGIQYDAVRLNFTIFTDLNTTRPIGNATIDRFYQGHQKKAHKQASLVATRKVNTTVNGKVYYRVDFATAVKYKILFWYTKRDRLWGGANVEIGELGEKVHKKPIRLGGNSPVRVESGAFKPPRGYRALVLFFAVGLLLMD